MSTAKRIYLVGASGNGKSTVADRIAGQAARLIVFDYLKTPDARRRQRALKLTLCTTLAQVRAIVSKNYAGVYRIWYCPPIDEQVEALSALSLFLWNLQELTNYRYPLTLYIDELAGAFPVYSLPKEKRGFYRICSAGRHVGINVVGASQKPAQVNGEFRGNLDYFFAFRLTMAADLDAVSAIGGRRMRNFCQTAPRYHYACLGEGGALTFGTTRS